MKAARMLTDKKACTDRNRPAGQSRCSALHLACKIAVIILPLYNLMFVLLWIWEQNQFDSSTDQGRGPSGQSDGTLARARWTPGDPTSGHTFNIQFEKSTLDSMNTTVVTHCVPTSTVPQFTVCVYPPDKDRYVSVALVSDGVWEPRHTSLFQKALRSYRNSTVLDIGANIGYYSLLSVTMGHRTFAVEPSQENLNRIKESVLRNGNISKLLSLVHNAMSDRRVNVTLTSSTDNQGGLWIVPLKTRDISTETRTANRWTKPIINTALIDDLVPFVGHTVIIKIDVEGHECRVLAGARRLLTSRYVPYVFMEWAKMYKSRQKRHTPCPVQAVMSITQMMTSLGYTAHELHTGFRLGTSDKQLWRIGDMYWRHKSAIQLQEPY